ncbi:MAG: hypothetical protein NW207_06165 [Cytophagales bacterium]|nr:hypothetical protein [Cytophagales bacterium]
MSLCLSTYAQQQDDVYWAHDLTDFNKKYQSDNNYANMCLGVPSIYPDTNLYNDFDVYTEGYILHFDNKEKKNYIKVSFPNPVYATQLVIGGVFNSGSISNIDIFTKENNPKNVYKSDGKKSIVKFRDFNIFFDPVNITSVRIEFDHRFINKWNVIKGIGLLASAEKFILHPHELELKNIKKQLVDENINQSECYQFAPKISPDGKTLFFVRDCNESKTGQDIYYYSLNDEGRWEGPYNIGKPVNNKSHNFVASVGQNSNFILLGNQYNANGEYLDEGVSRSHRTPGGKWGMPENIFIPEYKNYHDLVNYFMSGDEKTLIIAAQDERSLGELDLYVSMYDATGKKWSKPVHMGKDINTPYIEDYPYLASDGQTLYFCSKGHIGYGGYDIFMSKRLDDTWNKWSPPVNLGPAINSKTDDYGWSISSEGDTGYYSSVSINDTEHSMDLFKVNLPADLKQNPFNFVKVNVNNSFKKSYQFEVK